MVVRRSGLLTGISLGLAVFTSQLAAQVPALSGPHPVGTRRFEWIDSSRAEVATLLRRDTANAPQPHQPMGPRHLTVQLWYPVTAASMSLPRAPYNPSAAAFVGVIRDTARLHQYGTMSGRAALGGNPLSDQRFPLLVFSPGGSMFAEDYTILLEDLASNGYVVAAIGHPGTSLVALADGSFGVESAWRPPAALTRSLDLDSLRKSWSFFRTRDMYMAADIAFAVQRVADARWSPVAGVVDTSRMGFIGHSTGGSVVTTAAKQSVASRRALVVYDVILPAVLFDGPLAAPFMLFRTTATNYPAGWTERLLDTFAGVGADGFDVLVADGTHQGFSDRRLFAAVDSAPAVALRQLHATTIFSRVFFDRFLKNGGAQMLTDSTLQAKYGVQVTPHR
jgi:predicted ATPase